MCNYIKCITILITVVLFFKYYYFIIFVENVRLCFYGYYILKAPSNNEKIYKENFSPNSRSFIINIENDEFNEDSIIEANIDLTECTKSNENILSIGNDIKTWQGTGIRNLHIYYTKNKNELIVDWVNQDDPYASTANPKFGWKITLDKEILNDKITKNRLYINNIIYKSNK